jgi:hypothetical protein
MKILCTGNPTRPGIAQALSKKFNNITFIFRSNGFDLTTDDGIEQYKDLLLSHDVFINCSQVCLGSQENLLRIARSIWDQGRVINIGSVLEFKRWEWIDPVTAKEKRDLRDLSIELCSEHFKTTHLIVGGFQDREITDPLKFDPSCIADTIEWILNSDLHIPIMSVDRLTDIKIAHWKEKQCQM